MKANLPSTSNHGSSERAWAWSTVLLWLVLAVVWITTRGDYGMSWDEITRWNSGDNKLQYFEQLLAGDWSIWGSRSGSNLYPGLFDLPLSVYAKYIGGDRVDAGHIYSIFYSSIAVVGAGMLGRELGGWRLAFWASLLLAVMPRFYGHAVFNPKDIPFAATYTWGIWGVLRVARGFPVGGWIRWFVAGIFAGLAMATRLPGMIILAYLFGLVGYYFASQSIPCNGKGWRCPTRGQLVDGIGGLFIVGIISYGVLMLFYPASHQSPFQDSIRGVGKLHEFSTAIPVLFRGEVYTAGTTPWYYAPWMLTVTTPAWQLILLVGGVGLAVWHIVGMYRKGQWWDPATIRLGTVLLGFGFPLIYLLLTQPAIHNGTRHFMFTIPAGAVLMAFALTSFADALHERKARSVIVYGCFALAIAYNVSALARLHPYQYVYLNNVAGGPAAGLGYYETEYWFTSMREGLASLQQWRREEGLPEAPVRVMMTGPREIAEYQLPEGWVLATPGESADYFLGNTQFAGDFLMEGEVVIVIERMGLPILVIKDLHAASP